MSKLIKPNDTKAFLSAQKFEQDPFRLDHLAPPEPKLPEQTPSEIESGPEPAHHARPTVTAREEAAAIANEADEAARRVLQEAEANAKKTIEEAERRAQDIFRQARERGRADGAEEVRQQAERQRQASAQMLSSFIDQLKKREAELTQSLAPRLADLAIELAEKIIRKKLEQDPKPVVRQAEWAIGKILERDKLIIRVNPADEKMMKEHKASLIEMFDGIDKIEVIGDSGVEHGGCVVETDLIKVDAQPHTQLTAARNVIMGEIQK